MVTARSSRICLQLVALAFVLAGCDDSTAPNQPECTGPVDIQVSAGTTPRITWTPACRLFVLGVEGDDGDVWVIVSEGGNRIASGVRYGVVPAGATSDEAAIPLVAGQTYTIFAARHTGPGSDDGELAGLLDFVP
jgi:hypothetical protein